jgi:uncharacterized protein
MIAIPFARILLAAGLAVASLGIAAPAGAQQPSAGAILMAKEVVMLKGGLVMFDPLIPGVVETAKNTFLQQNPMLQRDLNEVAAQLRKDLDVRRADLGNEVAKVYATHFSEQELKDIATFYKTPLGRKMVQEEPKALQDSLLAAQTWADALSREVFDRIRDEMKKRGHNL